MPFDFLLPACSADKLRGITTKEHQYSKLPTMKEWQTQKVCLPSKISDLVQVRGVIARRCQQEAGAIAWYCCNHREKTCITTAAVG